jgi:hypothetical protein
VSLPLGLAAFIRGDGIGQTPLLVISKRLSPDVQVTMLAMPQPRAGRALDDAGYVRPHWGTTMFVERPLFPFQNIAFSVEAPHLGFAMHMHYLYW